MSRRGGDDPRQAIRENPLAVLELDEEARVTDVERASQRLLAQLEVMGERAARYTSPFGPARRDADTVRAAAAALRDPDRRIVAELLLERFPAGTAEAARSGAEERAPFDEALEAIGWRAR